MTSVLIHVHDLKEGHPLMADLQSAGIAVLGLLEDRNNLVQHVVRHAPDVVICDDAQAGGALFQVTQAIARTAACPVIVFTSVVDGGLMARAIESGIHVYVVNGFGAARRRPLIDLAEARFRHAAAQQHALQAVAHGI